MLLANIAHTWYARFVSELTLVVALVVKEGTEVEGGRDRGVEPVKTLFFH